jgi:regulatory protein
MSSSENQQKELSTLLFWAYRYIKYRLRTVKEMQEYLMKKAGTYGFSDERVYEALKYLIDEKYLDDCVFTEEFIGSRIRFKPKGEYALRIELRQKGVSDEIVDEYFQNHAFSEQQLAHESLKKAWRRYSRLPSLERKTKATSYLMRRGFGYSAIQKAIEEMEAAEYN